MLRIIQTSSFLLPIIINNIIIIINNHHHHSFLVESGRSLLSSMTLDEEVGEALRFRGRMAVTWHHLHRDSYWFWKVHIFIEQNTRDEINPSPDRGLKLPRDGHILEDGAEHQFDPPPSPKPSHRITLPLALRRLTYGKAPGRVRSRGACPERSAAFYPNPTQIVNILSRQRTRFENTPWPPG